MGQQSGRFIIEPYIWLSILSFYHFQKIKNKFLIIYFATVQPFLILFVLLYSTLFLSSGSLTNDLRKNVLQITANGFKLSEWANKKMNGINDSVIYTHRSISLPNFKIIPGDFLYYIKLDSKKDFEENEIYFQEIIKFSPKYILFYKDKFKINETGNPYYNFFKCTGDLVFSSNNVGKEATRNIFLNMEYRKSYSAYIYEFKIDNFPECLK